MEKATAAIYLAGHGSLVRPRLVELQYRRIQRYRDALRERLDTKVSVRDVFVDLQLPKYGMGTFDIEDVHETQRFCGHGGFFCFSAMGLRIAPLSNPDMTLPEILKAFLQRGYEAKWREACRPQKRSSGEESAALFRVAHFPKRKDPNVHAAQSMRDGRAYAQNGEVRVELTSIFA